MQPVATVPSEVDASGTRLLNALMQHPQKVLTRAGAGAKFTFYFRGKEFELALPVVGRIAGRDDTGYGDCSRATYVVYRVENYVTGKNKGRPHFVYLAPVTALSDTQVQHVDPMHGGHFRIQPVVPGEYCRWAEHPRANASWLWDAVFAMDAGINK